MTEQELEEHRYPNTGHLGLSSSATIFNRLPVGDEIPDTSPGQPTPATPGSVRLSGKALSQQVQILEEVLSLSNAEPLKHLVEFWLAKEICVALGGPFIEVCTQTLQLLLRGRLLETSSLSVIAQTLSENSTRPLDVSSMTTVEDFKHAISNTNARWETIALALTVSHEVSLQLNQPLNSASL